MPPAGHAAPRRGARSLAALARRGALPLLLLGPLSPACSPSAELEPAVDAMDASPPPAGAPLDGGCTRVPEVDAGAANGCHADWACVDAGTLTFVCQGLAAGAPDGGPVACACIGDGDTTVLHLPDPCASRSLGKIASAHCGWEVP